MRPFLTLHTPADARRHFEAGYWQADTFYGLLARNAAAKPDAIALRDARHTLSWSALKAWVDGAAAEMRAYGVAGGDRVSIWMGNRAEAVVTFLACAREGFACNPSLHRTYTCAEIGTLLDRLSARILVTEDGWGADRAAVDFDAELARRESLKSVFTPATFPKPGPNGTAPVVDPDKVVYLAFTSGTTGIPKCVMHSDNTLLANARDLVRDWGHGPDTVILSLSPLSHHIAWVAVAQWLLLGCVFATDDPPRGSSRLDWIEKTGATYLMGVPTHAMDVLAELRVRRRAKLGRVRVFYLAGSAIPPSLAETLVELGVQPQNVYGMTENSSHQYTHPTDDAATATATCGRGGGAYRIGIVDAADPDRFLPPGEIGQIAGRGAALMLGYFGEQGATESSFNRDGWFLSGDLGSLDAAGNLTVVGRLKDVIIRGGHNIHPAQVEALALRHPQVVRCACVPVPDERLGERMCLAVQGDAQPAALLRHLALLNLSKYDMPEFFVRVKAFPLTPSGKILKRELAAMLARGELLPIPVHDQIRRRRAS